MSLGYLITLSDEQRKNNKHQQHQQCDLKLLIMNAETHKCDKKIGQLLIW